MSVRRTVTFTTSSMLAPAAWSTCSRFSKHLCYRALKLLVACRNSFKEVGFSTNCAHLNAIVDKLASQNVNRQSPRTIYESIDHDSLVVQTGCRSWSLIGWDRYLARHVKGNKNEECLLSVCFQHDWNNKIYGQVYMYRDLRDFAKLLSASS